MDLIAFIPSPPQGVWNLGPLPIRAYALCILAGIFVAIWYGGRRWVCIAPVCCKRRQRGGSLQPGRASVVLVDDGGGVVREGRQRLPQAEVQRRIERRVQRHLHRRECGVREHDQQGHERAVVEAALRVGLHRDARAL